MPESKQTPPKDRSRNQTLFALLAGVLFLTGFSASTAHGQTLDEQAIRLEILVSKYNKSLINLQITSEEETIYEERHSEFIKSWKEALETAAWIRDHIRTLNETGERRNLSTELERSLRDLNQRVKCILQNNQTILYAIDAPDLTIKDAIDSLSGC